jgi:uncharacterized DUF497 family protein
MPYFHVFLWDDENEQHIAAHGVTKEEFEEVVLNSTSVVASASTGRPLAFGHTRNGRKLVCVYEAIDDIYCYPITAFDVP